MSEKLKRPRSLRMLGRTWKVQWVKEIPVDPPLEEGYCRHGECHHPEGIIKLATGNGEADAKLGEVLLHEILEELLYQVDSDLEHGQLTALGMSLFATLRDNPECATFILQGE
jgi:hypothetical protein